MTGRERFLKIARGELKGELFLPLNLNYSWFMEETLERWRREGMPPDADPLTFFGLDRIEFTGGGPYSFVPPFEEVVLEDGDDTQIVRDRLGITQRVFKAHGQSKMPQWLDFPVKCRGDFEDLKRRLDPDTPARYPADWNATKARWELRDHPLGIGPGSFFGHTLQRWVGPENLCLLFYDDPQFVHAMLDYLEPFFLRLVERFIAHAQFDFASFGEDIAFKGRSFLSPAMFREFLQPHYVSLCNVLRANGVETIFVDSDGNIDELIPLWREVGINGFSPMEVAAGGDPFTLKQRYGDGIVFAGCVDKRVLARDKAAIDREVEKVKRLLDMGGYFPAVDHSVPPDVPLENFRYFLQQLRATCA